MPALLLTLECDFTIDISQWPYGFKVLLPLFPLFQFFLTLGCGWVFVLGWFFFLALGFLLIFVVVVGWVVFLKERFSMAR